MVQLFGSDFDPIGSLVIGPVFLVRAIADYPNQKFRNRPDQKSRTADWAVSNQRSEHPFSS